MVNSPCAAFSEMDSNVFGLVFSAMQSGETSDCCITPEFNTNQCIFYPVKEEEREVLLGATQTSRQSLDHEVSGAAHQTELQCADSVSCESLFSSHIFRTSKHFWKTYFGYMV